MCLHSKLTITFKTSKNQIGAKKNNNTGMFGLGAVFRKQHRTKQ